MTQTNQPCLLVMAGGTGGHIFPGLAVADELKNKGWRIHWLGTAGKMEADIVPKQGYEISFIDISGVRNNGLLAKMLMPIKLIKSFLQARRVIKQVQPDVVIGMGGYASAPGGIAAWVLNVPLIVHEQNAAAGLTNRLLARFANKVCCAFPNAFVKTINAEVVGNPLRKNIVQKEKPIKERSKNILIVGGSLGAQVLNQVLPQSYKELLNDYADIHLYHQTGKGKDTEVKASYGQATLSSQKVKVCEFIDDMAAAYQWADIVICRAGALTVSEIAMAGKAAIFVPLPHAVDDHQTKNAQYLVNRNAARLLPQSSFNVESLTQLIKELFSKEPTLIAMEKAALEAADKHATEKVAAFCLQLSKR